MNAGLAARFRTHLRDSGWLEEASSVVVAASGGLDSTTLVHLLRFGGAAGSLPVHAAHLDHRMRPESGADAAWLAEVCEEWRVAFHLRAAPAPVRTEAEGRELRYAFLAGVARELGEGAVVMTAHTADDQAETVLFRVARGSGPRGLAGIRPGRSPSLVRPLLPFRRRELEAYATRHDVPFREDPSNRDPRRTRNRIRHEILPALEAAVPGASAALVSVAETSRGETAALDVLLDERIEALAAPASAAAGFRFGRESLAALPDPVLAVLLRRAAARLGGRPGRAATADLVRFVRDSTSGRGVTLAGGVTVSLGRGSVHVRPAGAERTATAGDGPGGRRRLRRVVHTAADIRRRVRELGHEIGDAYGTGDELLVLGMLKGSFIFVADLVREIPLPVHVDFLVAASYGRHMTSSGDVQLFHNPNTSISGRHVLLVEDIVDSGNTLRRVIPLLLREDPASLEICTLLHKRLVRLRKDARWVGFEAPEEFLVGYGLDFGEDFRHLPYIGSLMTQPRAPVGRGE